MSQLHMRPRRAVDHRQDHGLGHAVLCSKLRRTCSALCIDCSDLFNSLLCQFRSWVVLSLQLFWVLLVKAFERGTRLGADLRLVMGSMPSFSATSTFGHGVLSVVLPPSLVSATSAFGVSVFHVVELRSAEEVCRVDTRRVVTTMAACFSRLLSVFQEVRDAMSAQYGFLAASNPHTSVATNKASCPQPACTRWSMPWSLVYLLPKTFLFKSTEHWNFLVHSASAI